MTVPEQNEVHCWSLMTERGKHQRIIFLCANAWHDVVCDGTSIRTWTASEAGPWETLLACVSSYTDARLSVGDYLLFDHAWWLSEYALAAVSDVDARYGLLTEQEMKHGPLLR